jgi:hypothetical protein
MLPSMNAVIIQGSVFLGRSKNYSNNLKANYQCHIVNSFLFDNLEINVKANETLNNFTLLKDQPPQLLVFNIANCCANNQMIQKINFKEHICECCGDRDFYLFPYCSYCFLYEICDLVTIDFSKFSMKANKEMKEKSIVFEYLFDHKTTLGVIEEYYEARNIPVSLMSEFSISVIDESNAWNNLVYDYSDHLCVLHFIKSAEQINQENCKILCIWKDGKYCLQLLTTKNILSKEEILIPKRRILKSNYCTRYLI